jgi:hypothetical protein
VFLNWLDFSVLVLFWSDTHFPFFFTLFHQQILNERITLIFMNFSSTCFSFCDSNCNKKEYALCRGSTFLYNFIPFWSVKQLLVLFAWEEIFSQSIRVSPFLSRLLIPFLVLVIILFLLDLAGNQYNIHFLSFSFIFDFILTNWTLFCFVLFCFEQVGLQEHLVLLMSLWLLICCSMKVRIRKKLQNKYNKIFFMSNTNRISTQSLFW